MHSMLNTTLAYILQALAKPVTQQLHVGSPTSQICVICQAYLYDYLIQPAHTHGLPQKSITHSAYSSALSKMNSHQLITLKTKDFVNSKSLTKL